MSARVNGALRRRRPRAVWAATLTGAIVSAVVVVGVLLPVLGLIGAADATTAGQLDVPVGLIALGIVISLVVGLAMIAVAAMTRSGVVAWIAAVSAVVATLVGSAWPLVATTIASVDQVQDAIPFVQDLIGRVLGG
ncbi:putative Tic20 family protein [Clavibacter michiganensis]|nr:putative Tic20 family protein [Clavibacter michiganensis]